MKQPIPATVVGGYLGAGKTSLVNHVLRNARGRRIAVLVNDFGALPIDADLIEAREGDLISIAGGCICCSFGSDLIDALARLAARAPAPDHVLIETSGVSTPRAVGQSAALLPAYQCSGVVVVADAGSVRERAVDRYTGDTVLQQLREADVIALNKLDLLADEKLEEVRSWISQTAPKAVRAECIGAKVPVELLPGFGLPPSGSRSAGAYRSPRNAAARFRSEAFLQCAAVDVEQLARALANRVPGLLRAKGVLEDVDGSLKSVHFAGSRWEIQHFAGVKPPRRGLICIGPRDALEREAIARLLEFDESQAFSPR